MLGLWFFQLILLLIGYIIIMVLLKWRLVNLTRHGGHREVFREPQSSFVMREARRLQWTPGTSSQPPGEM